LIFYQAADVTDHQSRYTRSHNWKRQLTKILGLGYLLLLFILIALLEFQSWNLGGVGLTRDVWGFFKLFSYDSGFW